MREQLYAADPHYLLAYLDKVGNASESDRARAHELYASALVQGDAAVDAIFEARGDTAVISIAGPLSMAGPDALDLYYGYGGVSYPAIIGAIERAMSDQFARVLCLANTPGGEVNGADQTWQAMTELAAKKRTTCRVSGMLASAGYYIMCPARIEATSPTDLSGSIGVIIAGYDWTGALDSMGVKKYSIVSKNAPQKAADLSTKAGRDVLQERVDAIERIFYQRISEARGVTPDFIRENYGRGSLLVARDPDSTKPDALRSKLIDALASEPGEFPISQPGNEDDDDDEDEDEDEDMKAGSKKNGNYPADAGTSHSQEVNVTTLSEFLAQGPAAVAEIDKIKADAASAAVAPLNARITKCATILGSEAYSKNAPVRAKAIACLEGKISVDALDGVIGMADMLAEQGKQSAAAGEQQGQGETKPGAPDAKAQEEAEINGLAALISGKKEGK